ncbi:MAG TPA: hypothetical protein VHG29_09630 [Novosphingobium sp.]|nr:hypothetical protein [Novosphingobium sp.]
MSPLPYRARGFGLTWGSDVPLERFDSMAHGDGKIDIAVRRVAGLPDRGPSRPVGRGQVFANGFRLAWSDALVFDVHGSTRVDYAAQPAWRGVMPPGLYSTIASLLLAGRGILPLHATALEWQGRAFLFAGDGGAGKSTFAAELLAAGAQLIGDDLSAVEPPAGPGAPFTVRRGRAAMRLHPATAALVDAERSEAVPDDPRGKVLVRPKRRVDEGNLPLAGIFLLGDGDIGRRANAARLLARLLFRPRWCAALPAHRERQVLLLKLANAVPLRRLPPVTGFDPHHRAARIAQVLAMLAG